jgi:hypothetical protein
MADKRGEQHGSPFGVETEAGAASRDEVAAPPSGQKELREFAVTLAPARYNEPLGASVLVLKPCRAASSHQVRRVHPLSDDPFQALRGGRGDERLSVASEKMPRRTPRRAVVEAELGE